MSIQIEIDDRALKEIEKKLGEISHRAPGVMSSSLNRTVTNISSNIRKEVRERYHIKAGDIRNTIETKKASSGSLSASVISKGRTIPLDKFKVNPKTANPRRKKQLKIAVKKDGVKQVLGAFISDLHGLKVFKRSSKKRLPIERLFGPSVPQMIKNESISEKVESEAVITFDKRVTHEINRMLNNLGAFNS